MPNYSTDQTGENTGALVPRSLFAGEVKPGDTVTMKVAAVYGDEVELQTLTAEAEEPEEPEEGEESEETEEMVPPPMTADQEFEQAATMREA